MDTIAIAAEPPCGLRPESSWLRAASRPGWARPEEVAHPGLLGALDGHLHGLVELGVRAVDAGTHLAD
jgi:hypothetical protein